MGKAMNPRGRCGKLGSCGDGIKGARERDDRKERGKPMSCPGDVKGNDSLIFSPLTLPFF